MYAVSLFTAAVDVRLKPGVLDPQGQAVAGALRTLGLASVEDVRVGKHVVVRLRAPDEAGARAAVERMCRELLASPVLEDFAYTLWREPADEASAAGAPPAGAAGGGVP